MHKRNGIKDAFRWMIRKENEPVIEWDGGYYNGWPEWSIGIHRTWRKDPSTMDGPTVEDLWEKMDKSHMGFIGYRWVMERVPTLIRSKIHKKSKYNMDTKYFCIGSENLYKSWEMAASFNFTLLGKIFIFYIIIQMCKSEYTQPFHGIYYSQ